MRITNTTRWVSAGAALGLSAALSAGAAFAATPGSSGHAGSSQPTMGASRHVLAAATTPASPTTITTTPASSPNASSGTQAPAGSSPMMSAMLASLSPQARAELQALYPQMLKLMGSSAMMGGNGTAASMMGQRTAGNRPTADPASSS